MNAFRIFSTLNTYTWSNLSTHSLTLVSNVSFASFVFLSVFVRLTAVDCSFHVSKEKESLYSLTNLVSLGFGHLIIVVVFVLGGKEKKEFKRFDWLKMNAFDWTLLIGGE
jgi:hypothetical protein